MTLNDTAPDQRSPVPGPLRVDLHRDCPDATVIYVHGELDRATAPILASRLNPLVDADTGRTNLVIDLTTASFVDVGGLNLLLDAQRRAKAAGTAFCLAGCSRQVLRILQVTDAIKVIRLVPSHRDAGGVAAAVGTASAAHTDLPSLNSVTPHRIDSAATTCNPRPRRARGSIGRRRGGGPR